MANPQPDKYIKISSELWDAFCRVRIAGEARQMLDTIIRKTYGYNKKEDKIATSQFMQLTGLPNFAIHKARKKLLKMNMITITKKGNSQILTYSLQKDYDKWKLLPKKVTVTKKGRHYNQKRLQVSPKKVTKCNPKSDTQYTIDNYTINNITKDTAIVCKYFYQKFKEAFGKDYIANFGKDGKILKDLLKIIPLDELKQLIDTYLTTPDVFAEKVGYTTGLFKTRINSLRIDKKTLSVSEKTLKSVMATQSWLKKKGEVIDVG